MKTVQLLGLGLIGLGIFCVAMADDTGGFRAVFDYSESEDGPVFKLAMQTNLFSVPSQASGPAFELPAGPLG